MMFSVTVRILMFAALTISSLGGSAAIGMDPGGSCLGGYWKDPDTSSCVMCPAGKYNEDGVGPCKPCPEKKWSAEGSFSCEKCGDGYGFKDWWSNTCELCPIGKYHDKDSWANKCEDCNYGKTTVGEGTIRETQCICKAGYRSEGDECHMCDPDTFKANVGEGNCEACPPGLVTHDMLPPDKCVCREGTYFDSGVDACLSCPYGTYKHMRGNEACKSCGDGATTKYTGSTYEDDCKCIAGYTHEWSNLAEKYACVKCQVGYYKSVISNLMCNGCPYQKSTTFMGATNKSDCLCAKGKEPTTDPTSYEDCSDCKKGFYKDFVGDEPCVPCPVGSTTYGSYNNDNVTKCSRCLKGYGGQDCEICPKGSVSEHETDREWAKCDKCQMEGVTTPQAGSFSHSDCKLCAGGYGGDASNHGICVGCAVNFSKAFDENTECKPCKNGWFSPEKARFCKRNFTISEIWDLSFLSGGRRSRGNNDGGAVPISRATKMCEGKDKVVLELASWEDYEEIRRRLPRVSSHVRYIWLENKTGVSKGTTTAMEVLKPGGAHCAALKVGAGKTMKIVKRGCRSASHVICTKY